MIILLFFVLVSVMVTSSAVIMAFVNSQSATKVQEGSLTLGIAESGAENAVLRLLRDPAYTGESLPINDGTATITVSTAGSTKTIVSTGTLNNFVRKIQVVADYTNNKLTISSWKEIP